MDAVMTGGGLRLLAYRCRIRSGVRIQIARRQNSGHARSSKNRSDRWTLRCVVGRAGEIPTNRDSDICLVEYGEHDRRTGRVCSNTRREIFCAVGMSAIALCVLSSPVHWFE